MRVLRPTKATPRPYTRHILGIDSGVQSHPKATPRLHQGHTKATPKPHQSHTKATPKPHPCDPQATHKRGLSALFQGSILELPPSRARKPEIRNSKPETNPKHQGGNDQNHYPAGGSWPWTIWHLNLFRVSSFGFRIWDHSAGR